MAIALTEYSEEEEIEQEIRNDAEEILSMTDEEKYPGKEELSSHLSSVYDSMEFEVSGQKVASVVEEAYDDFFESEFSLLTGI